MSDYLNSLVDRTLRLAPVVQPRLASLFEPPSTDIAPEAAAMPESNSMSGESQSSESAPEVSPVRLPLQASQQIVMKNVGVTDAPADSKTLNTEDRVRMDQQLNPPPSLVPPAPLADQIIQQPTFSQTSFKTAVPAGETHVLHEADPPNSLNAVAMKSSSEAKTFQSHLDQRSEVRESPAKDRQPVQPTLISPKSQSVTVPFAAKQSTTNRRENAQASIPTEQPETVVVTIGRVDVRAVFTPRTATRQPNRAPVKPMSLDEYLKQQSEGRR